MRKFLFILVSFFTATILLHAQNLQKIDSINKAYNSSPIDSVKLKALMDLFAEYRYTNDSAAQVYVNSSINFAKKINFTRGLGQALYNKGVFEGEKGNFDSSDVYISEALKQYQKINHASGIAYCNMAFGFNCYDKGDFSKALNYFLEAARLRDKTSDKKNLAGTYIWIGNVYNNGLDKPKEALPYYHKALEIQKSFNDEANMAYTYNNIGNSYYFLKQPQEALSNYLLSASIKEKLGNKRGLSSSNDNIGNVYVDLKNYDKALEYYQKALATRQEFEDKKGITTSYVNIGNVYIALKKYNEAIELHKKALALAEEIGNKEAMKESSNSIAACYEALGDYKLAFRYYKYSSAIKDSILNTSFTEQIAEMQTRYDVEKKDLELAKNKAEIETKEKQVFIKNIIIASIIILALMLIISGTLFYRKKQIEQKARLDASIAHEKELRTRAILEAEEKERRRIAQDLHDGVGQLLSAAKMNLSNLDSKIQIDNEEQRTAMQNAISLVDDSVKEVRTVSHNMMPNTLIKLGLASAIREFITKLGNAPTLKVDLEIVGLDSRLDNQVETVLYRVIQEVINNIIKHAKASQISMQLVRHETELNVMIEDNGVGFDTNKLETYDGIGLKGIQTRIELLGGTVHFDSAIGRGTTVIIDVPLS